MPDKFEGDRSKTEKFLSQFRRYAMLNQDSNVMRDPFKRSSIFLGLMSGLRVDEWVQIQDQWLKRVECKPDLLLFGMTPWEVTEKEF
jgi:hypothetical protein